MQFTLHVAYFQVSSGLGNVPIGNAVHLKQDRVGILVLVLWTLRLECPVPHGAWCPEELRITAQVIIGPKQGER